MAGTILGPQLRFSSTLSTDVRCEAASDAGAAPQHLRTSVDQPRLGSTQRFLTVENSEPLGSWSRGQRHRALRGSRSKVTLLQDDGLLTEDREKEELSSAVKNRNSYIGFGVVIQDESVYRERFVVRFSEVGANGTTSLEILSSLLQETACNHVLEMDYKLSPGKNEGKLITVTTRMHIEVDRYPAWRDLLEIDTWFQIEGRASVRRDWTVKNVKTGDVIAVATSFPLGDISKWVIMNAETKRLAKLTDDLRDELVPHVKDPPRWAMTEDRMKASSAKIATLDSAAEFRKCGLVPSVKDFDMNQHVNNVRYMSWMLESIPDDVKKEYEVGRITLEYRREAFAGDIIESLASPEPSSSPSDHDNSTDSQDLGYIHLLRTVDGDYEVNRGRTVWRKARKHS